MPLSEVQKRLRVLLRASRLSGARRDVIREAQTMHRDAFDPLADAYLKHLDGLITGSPADATAESYLTTMQDYLARIAMDSEREIVVERLTWIFASAYLRLRAASKAVLGGNPPAAALALSRAYSTAYYGVLRGAGEHTGSPLQLAYDSLDPMASMLAELGKRLELNLSTEEYYSLGALERTQATTVWGVADESVRRQIMKELQAAAENGEAFFSAQPGAQSFYNRIRQMFGTRFGGGSVEDDRYPLAGWHLNTIFHTNIATVTHRAIMDEAWESRENFPYIEYLNPDPVFHACIWLSNGGAARGKIFRIDDPIVRQFVPPLHFNCDTTVVSVMEMDLPASKRGKSPVSSGSDIPPDVQPEFYAGPFNDPLKGRSEPFGRWEPKGGIPSGIMRPPPSDTGGYIAGKTGDIKIKLNALRSERQAIAALEGLTDAEKKQQIKILNARIGDLKAAERFLVELATPVDNIRRYKDVEGLRQRIYGADAVRAGVKRTAGELADMPRRGSELFEGARKTADIARRDLVYMLENHAMNAAEAFEISTRLLDRIVFADSVPASVQSEILDALRFLPTDRLARVLLATEKFTITVDTLGLADVDRTLYDPLGHTIRIVRTESGRIPADLAPLVMREFIAASVYLNDTTDPALGVTRRIGTTALRPELVYWLRRRHTTEIRRLFGSELAAEFEKGEYGNLYPILVESVFSWLSEPLGEFAEPTMKAKRRIRRIVSSPGWNAFALDFLREF